MPDEMYHGPERRENDRALAALRLEMAQVRATVDAATEDLVTQESLNRTAKRAATRLGATYLLAAVAIAVVGSLIYSNQRTIEDVSRDARTAATTLNDCLLAGGKCYEELSRRGTQGSVRQLKFQACVLAQIPEQRSADYIIACAKKAYPEVDNLNEQLRAVLP